VIITFVGIKNNLKMKRILFYLFIFVTFFSNAQNPGDVAQDFGNGYGFAASPRVTAIQSDGKIIVGGYFVNYNNVSANYIIRLNADGTRDASFDIGTGFNDYVNSIRIQLDGKIIVAGKFTTYKGVARNRIVRLNSDGSVDASFNIGTGLDGEVFSLCLQSDGKIIVGGSFGVYNAQSAVKIVRLNSDGTKDASFSSGSGFNGSLSVVNDVKVQSNGKIVVGGKFSSYSSTSVSNIIRLNSDGTVDSSFVSGTGFSDVVNRIAIQADGGIIVGGNFVSYNGVTANRIIRLNSDGTKDAQFATGSAFGDNSVRDVKISGNKILVGGSFTSYNGSPVAGIVQLLADGSKDLSFNLSNVSLINGTLFTVESIEVESSGKILVGSNKALLGGRNISGLTRLNAFGANDGSMYQGNGFTNLVKSTAQQNDGKLIIGGDFTFYNNIHVHRLCRLNTDGTLDVSFNVGTGFNDVVNKVLVLSDGKILVGGRFTTYNGTTVNRLVRLNSDGSIDASFVIGSGFDSEVNTIALQMDGKILFGGMFTNYKGVPVNYIIRLNTDGVRDASFVTGNNGSSVHAIAVQSDGRILVGGNVTNKIIRLNTDGTLDSSFNPGTGFDQIVQVITLQTDGKILVGGNFFSTFNGLGANRIIRLNTDGTKDTSFNYGTGFNSFVRAITVQSDGKILVGGSFTTYSGTSDFGLIRLNNDGSKDTSFNIGNGFSLFWFVSQDVYTINMLNDGKILVGGNFSSYKGSYASSSLIKLHSGVVLSSESFELNNSVSVWPNPVNDVLNVSSIDNLEILSVKIYDLQGKLIIDSNKDSINTDGLSPGLYLANIFTEKGMLTKKIIKK
jgi:uncharacterized delta-60 repeat protein